MNATEDRQTTCQICGRPIRSKSGLIAHHGYRRPGQGWQTSSCYGARRLPYEVSCDAIPPYLEMLTRMAEHHEALAAKMEKDPPASLVRDDGPWSRRNKVELQRPEGYVYNPGHPRTYMPNTYECALVSAIQSHKNTAGMVRLDIPVLQKRLADWRAP